MKKARQVVVNSLQLAHLNSMGCAWYMGTVSSCLVSGSGAIRAAAQTPGAYQFHREVAGDVISISCSKRGTTSLQPEPQNWIKTVFKKKRILHATTKVTDNTRICVS